MKRIVLISLLVFAMLFASCSIDSTEPVGERYEARVTDVFSGDTIKVLFDDEKPSGCRKQETVKLIGVKAPALNGYPFIQNEEYYAFESFTNMATYFNKKVYVELDDVMDSRTKDGYLTAYVWASEPLELLNKSLLKEGFAEFDGSVNFNSSRMKEFIQASEFAQNGYYGMWQ